MYGMAGVAAAAGIAFFVNNRLLKNKQGQQGPIRRVRSGIASASFFFLSKGAA